MFRFQNANLTSQTVFDAASKRLHEWAGSTWMLAITGLVILALPLVSLAEDKTPTSDIPASLHGVREFRTHLASGGAQIVIVGVNKCRGTNVKIRKHAEADARALAGLFSTKEYFGAPAENIQLLVGTPDANSAKEKEATRQNVVEALRKAIANSGDGDLVIFAFIGQGASVGESGSEVCFFASDSTLDDRENNAISERDLARAFNELGTAHLCAFLDVHFRGFESDDPIPNPSGQAFQFSQFGGQNSRGRFFPERVLFLATDGLTQSPDLAKHGSFAEALLLGLRGEADNAGGEPDGLVTVKELIEYLKEKLPKLRSSDGDSKLQHYVLMGHYSDFPLTYNPGPAKIWLQRIDRFQKIVEQRKVPTEFLPEGLELLNRSPKLEFSRELRKLYLQLVEDEIAIAAFQDRRSRILDRAKIKNEDAAAFVDKVFTAAHFLDENYVRKASLGELISWAIESIYKSIDERLPLDVQKRLRNKKTLDQDQLKEILSAVRVSLGNREDLASHKDIEFALYGMLGRLDSFSTYYNAEYLSKQDALQQTFTGIGVTIQNDSKSGYLMIASPIKGSPAYRAGIQSGDLITTITLQVDPEGRPLMAPKAHSTKGLSIDEVSRLLLGKAGVPVKLTVRRPDGAINDLTIERASVQQETVWGTVRKRDDSWSYMLDPKARIGYIRITTFTSRTPSDLRTALSDLKDEGMKALVLDLRFNGGGTLSDCVEVADMFIDDGPILIQRSRKGKDEVTSGHKEGSLLNFPMVCLVNELSASGAEIVAVNLQDYQRAAIAGERTNGSANVQRMYAFDNGYIRYTTSIFLSPKGRNLDRENAGNNSDVWGVVPDKNLTLNHSPDQRGTLLRHLQGREVIPRKGEELPKKAKEFKDEQLKLALSYLVEQLK